MPVIRHAGVGIHYECHGAGTALVFLHAGSTNSSLWLFQALTFARSYQVVLIDHRGHGQSDKPHEPYGIPTHAGDVAAVLDTLGIESAVFIGNSIGGMTALQFNLDHPARVLGNVLLSTGTGLGRDMTAEVRAAMLGNFLTAFDAMMEGTVSARTRRERPELLPMLKAFHQVPSNYPEHSFAASFGALDGPFDWDIAARLHEILAPTLVLAGSEDQLIPPAVSATLAAAIPGAVYREIEQVGHFFQLEQPLAFNAELAGFLEGLRA